MDENKLSSLELVSRANVRDIKMNRICYIYSDETYFRTKQLLDSKNIKYKSSRIEDYYVIMPASIICMRRKK